MKRKPEPDNLQRWLLTYADLITLLLGFFVILYTLSQVNETRYRKVSSALQNVFGQKEPETIQSASAIQPVRLTRQMLSDSLTDVLDRALLNNPELESAVTLVPQFDGIALRFQDRVLFDLGEADIKPKAKTMLLSLTAILARFPNRLRIDGHTDNLPIHNVKFASNWQLSTARAANVAHLLQEKGGINGKRISVTGHASFDPAQPNTTEKNRAINRRVEIVVLDE
ncbi:OmpA family protein [bacterium]|nr:OmpA family protein [bacterium]